MKTLLGRLAWNDDAVGSCLIGCMALGSVTLAVFLYDTFGSADGWLVVLGVVVGAATASLPVATAVCLLRRWTGPR